MKYLRELEIYANALFEFTKMSFFIAYPHATTIPIDCQEPIFSVLGSVAHFGGNSLPMEKQSVSPPVAMTEAEI